MKPCFNPTFILLSMLFVLASCKTEDKQNEKQTETKASIVSGFIEDISYLETVRAKSQIVAFEKEATAVAARMIQINKDNIASIFAKAKHYRALVITVEDHTIVKITDLEDCKPSGSWEACMPVGEGYIKKDRLIKKKDYINNIIGVFDGQERVAYLFN